MFVYYEDGKKLLEKGLIKGGSLDSAVIIREMKSCSRRPCNFIMNSPAT